MTTTNHGSRLVFGIIGLMIGLAPVVVAVGGSADPAPRVLADCNDVVDDDTNVPLSNAGNAPPSAFTPTR